MDDIQKLWDTVEKKNIVSFKMKANMDAKVPKFLQENDLIPSETQKAVSKLQDVKQIKRQYPGQQLSAAVLNIPVMDDITEKESENEKDTTVVQNSSKKNQSNPSLRGSIQQAEAKSPAVIEQEVQKASSTIEIPKTEEKPKASVDMEYKAISGPIELNLPNFDNLFKRREEKKEEKKKAEIIEQKPQQEEIDYEAIFAAKYKHMIKEPEQEDSFEKRMKQIIAMDPEKILQQY